MLHHQSLHHITLQWRSQSRISVWRKCFKYQHDFIKRELFGTSFLLKFGTVSREDRTIMETVEKRTSRKDDHYVVPLPFRDSNLMLPNNKKQAIQRLMGLKKRFMKANKFFEDYLKFLENLLRSAYVKRSDASPSGKNWYILHHEVYYP